MNRVVLKKRFLRGNVLGFMVFGYISKTFIRFLAIQSVISTLVEPLRISKRKNDTFWTDIAQKLT